MIVGLVTGSTGPGVKVALGFVFAVYSLGSGLSLGRCIGRLLGLLVVCLLVDCADLFAKLDQSR